MNNFNKVFLSIKDHDKKGDLNEDGECFKIVAKDAGIPIGELSFYLEILQELVLISYSRQNRSITLTDKGRKQQTIFADDPGDE